MATALDNARPASSGRFRAIDRYLQIGRLQRRPFEYIVGTSRDDKHQIPIDAERHPVARLAGVDADRDGAVFIRDDILKQANRRWGSPKPNPPARKSIMEIVVARRMRAAGSPQTIHGWIAWRHQKAVRSRTGIFHQR